MSPSRALIARERLRARTGSLAESAENTSNAFTTVVWIAGIGFAIYAVLNWIAPAILGGATRTRDAYRRLKPKAPEPRHFSPAPSAADCAATPYLAECARG